MAAIHLIKKTGDGLPPIVPVAGEANTYTSGFWTLTEDAARRLIGGRIYFHEHQRDPSFYGGQILSVETSDGKIVFRFLFSQDCRGVKTSRDGWGQEMKVVHDAA